MYKNTKGHCGVHRFKTVVCVCACVLWQHGTFLSVSHEGDTQPARSPQTMHPFFGVHGSGVG